MGFLPIFIRTDRPPAELISPAGIQVVNWVPLPDLFFGELWLDDDVRSSSAQDRREAAHAWFVGRAGAPRVVFGYEEDAGQSPTPGLARRALTGWPGVDAQVWLAGGLEGSPPAGWERLGTEAWEQPGARPRWAR